MIEYYQRDCFDLLESIDDGSVDLILTDPPFGISQDSGYVNNAPDKKDYIAKYGKHKIDFGEWDTKEVDMKRLAAEFYRVLRKGGVAVVFYDMWYAQSLKDAFNKFRQPRILQWVKTNPVPINSKINFLSNAIEFAFSFVKVGKPTYNSEYNPGIFKYPIVHGKERTKHPTQKPLMLMSDIMSIYSHIGDRVCDPFLGSGTTAVACIANGRRFIGSEMSKDYFKIATDRIKSVQVLLEGFQ